MAITATLDPVVARVVVAVTGLPAAAVSVRFERMTPGVVGWTTIRGGSAVAVAANAAQVSDYEYPAGILVQYRATALDNTGATVSTQTVSNNADVPGGQIWLIDVGRPWLNQPINFGQPAELTAEDRGTTVTVAGRSRPVAMTDTRGALSTTIEVVTNTTDQWDTLEALLLTGDVVFTHSPAGRASRLLPSRYWKVGDWTRRQLVPGAISDTRIWTLPLQEVAAPGPSVVGSTITWGQVVARYSTWADVVAGAPTWGDLVQQVGNPAVVIQ